MANSEEPILELIDITKHFPGVLANDHVSLTLNRGEVLALLGENGAGKSTLMNVLVGLYRPDSGEIKVQGNTVEIHSPRDAATLGIGMVHQNFKLVPTMTVAQNIILGMTDLPFVPDMDSVIRKIHEIGIRYNLRVDPRAYIWQLSVGEQQRVEILKLLYRGADILILDEPTAVLTPQEAHELGQVIHLMQAEGKSTIFITHKMEEVMEFSDWVCVLRQGKLAAVKRTQETSPNELARMMVGREVLFRLEKDACELGEIALRLNLVKASNDKGLPALNGITMKIHQGEIFGIAGVAGNGQRELAEVITGLRPITGGSLFLRDKNMTNHSPLAMIREGVSHIPADRIGMGAVGDMGVADNIAMKGYRSAPLVEKGLLNPKRILEYARNLIDVFRITTPTPQTHIKFLSGGNIQKAILAREIEACRGLLVAAYPSRGLDVGATEAVRKRLLEQRSQGKAVLLISEDLEELLTVADRVGVLFEGQLVGTLATEEANVETLGLMMAGVLPETQNIAVQEG